jgi:hypothetical protein
MVQPRPPEDSRTCTARSSSSHDLVFCASQLRRRRSSLVDRVGSGWRAAPVWREVWRGHRASRQTRVQTSSASPVISAEEERFELPVDLHPRRFSKPLRDGASGDHPEPSGRDDAACDGVSSGQKVSSDCAAVALAGAGTNGVPTSKLARARLEVDGVAAEIDVAPGEAANSVSERMAEELRRKGVVAHADGKVLRGRARRSR